MPESTFAVIFGNRDFFPTHLVGEARQDILQVFAQLDLQPVMLDEAEATLGSVETYDHARHCADLFKKNADRIDGILVVLPNFGNEKGVADAIQLSGLRVPVLVQAYSASGPPLSADPHREHARQGSDMTLPSPVHPAGSERA